MKGMLRLVLGIMAIALLVAAPASATYMDMQVDSNWSFTITGGTYTLTNLSNFAFMESASYLPAENVGPTTNNTGPNVGASVSATSGPNLLHQEAYNSPGVQTSHTHVTGQGPTAPGFLEQDVIQGMRFALTVDATGVYQIQATDIFDVIAIGNNSSGVGAYRVEQNYEYKIALSGGGLDYSEGGSTEYSYNAGIGNVVIPWDASKTGQTQGLDLGAQNLVFGTTYILTVSDEAYQNMYTYTAVPVPPSLLLLGSGLLGLVGLRYRRRS